MTGNVQFKKFKQARVYGGSNFDSLKVGAPVEKRSGSRLRLET